MKVLFYLSSWDGCGYYRVDLIAKYLNKKPDVIAKISSAYKDSEIKEADIIILQKQHNPQAIPFIERGKAMGKPFVTECDDDYFSIPISNPAHSHFKDKKDQLATFYKISDALTVTTEHLRSRILPYNPNIYVLPNSLDIKELDRINKMSDKYKHTQYIMFEGNQQVQISLEEARQKMSGKILIGWAGSPTHKDDLDQVTDALAKICKNYKNVMLVFMACCTDTILRKIPHDQILLVKPVPIFMYPQVLSTMGWDIGICPIADNLFNKSKSNLKFLEFSVNSYTCVCSNIENYAKTVVHGETGLLAENTENSWYENLANLIENEKYRKTLGENARNFVRDRFDIDKNVDLWYNCYQEIIEKK